MIEREKTNHQKLVAQRVSDNFWFKPIWESGRVHTQEETLGQCQKTEERKENFGWSTNGKTWYQKKKRIQVVQKLPRQEVQI
jgi:hypothetical protein